MYDYIAYVLSENKGRTVAPIVLIRVKRKYYKGDGNIMMNKYFKI